MGMLKDMGSLKKVVTINPGIFQEQLSRELAEELELQEQDRLELLELQSRNKLDVHKEAWDEVAEKKADENEEEVQEKKEEVTVELERLPRVSKPVGDVLDVIMKLDLGERQVELLKWINFKEIERILAECITQVSL